MAFVLKSDLAVDIQADILDDVIEDDDTLITDAAEIADSLIIDHLSARYDIQTDLAKTGGDRHKSLLDQAKAIVIYKIHMRVHPDDVPELRAEAFDTAMRWLMNVRKGNLNPVGLTPYENDTHSYVLGGSSDKRQNTY